MLGLGTFAANSIFNNDNATKSAQNYKVQTGPLGAIPAWWQDEFFGASVCPSDEYCGYEADPDGDKLNNGQEYYYKTDPNKVDTNENGSTDGEDVAQNIDPSKPGSVSFEVAASDEMILGESLVFDQDIKDVYNEAMDISKVPIQLIPDSKLEIITQESEEIYTRYFKDVENTINDYLPADDQAQLLEQIEKGSSGEVLELSRQALALSMELEKIKVPAKIVGFHKYMIALYQTIYDLAVLDEYSGNDGSPESDAWYDKAQGLFAVLQRLQLEKDKISTY